MPPSDEPKATPGTTSTTSTEPSQEAPVQSETAANGTGTESEATTAQPSWRTASPEDRAAMLSELLDSTDSDTLIKQPKLSGLLGDMAERRARAKEVEIEKRVVERHEQQRLRKLRDEDPYAYAVEQKRQEDQAASAESTNAEHQRTLVAWAQEINNEIGDLTKTLPPDVVAKLSSKRYEGTLGQGLKAYVADIIDGSKSAWLAEQQETWKKDLLPALRKEALAAVNGGTESSPDDTTGGSAPSGALTQSEWQRNGSDRIWRQANKARINEALTRGAIRPLA